MDGDQSVARQAAEETAPSSVTALVETKEEETVGASAVPEEVVHTPSLSIDAPESVAMAGDLREFTVSVLNYDLEQTDSLMLTSQERIWFDLQYYDGSRWLDAQFVDTDSPDWPHRAQIPLDGPELLMRVGISEQTFTDNWFGADEFLASGTADLGFDAMSEGQLQVPTIGLLAQLSLKNAPIGTVETISIPALSPTVDIVGEIPETVAAGSSLDFVVEVGNETNHDYGSVSLFHTLTLLTAEEADRWQELDNILGTRSDLTEAEGEQIGREMRALFDVEEGQLTLTCSAEGEDSRVIAGGADEHPFYGRGSYVFSGGLDAGARITVSCDMRVGADVPDAHLTLFSFLMLGENAVPMAYDPSAEPIVVSIVGATAPAEPPAPKPTKPTPAQPAPVRPTPTPTSPPAAAPVRQVPTTQLPRTGTDPLPLAAAGLGLVLVGAAALVGGRRRADN